MNYKYAHIERERRFLLFTLPPDLDHATYLSIEDVYITGTQLRLRRMSSPAGETLALKLGQKFRAPGQIAHETMMTNLYLNEVEYQALQTLPGRRLRKQRYEYEWHGRRYAIDRFLDQLTGLLLMEIEGESDAELVGLPLPEFAVCEVTALPFFTGGNLVLITNDQLQAQLSQFLEAGE